MPSAAGAETDRASKVCEANPMVCSCCGSPMRVLAVTTEPQQVRKIPLHLIKTSKVAVGFHPRLPELKPLPLQAVDQSVLAGSSMTIFPGPAISGPS